MRPSEQPFETPPKSSRLALLGRGAALFAAASIVFYLIALAHFGLDVPVEDDLELLDFVLGRQAGGGAGWLALHNEHRPAVARALFYAAAQLQGRLDFRVPMWLGACALLGVAALLYAWLPRAPAWSRVALAGPVCVLLFSLQHWQGTIWATGAAQHYPTLLFALGSLSLLARPDWPRTLAGGALATLALYDLGAGLFVFAVGLALLLLARAFRPAAAFAAWGALCVGLYFWGYARPDHHPSVLAVLADPVGAFDYACSLLGAGLSFDDTRVGWLARFAGAGMWVALAVHVLDRRWRDEPEVFGALCFVALTLASVTVTRFGFGLDQAFDSRYRIYSHLFMSLLWISWLRRRAGDGRSFEPVVTRAAASALVFALALNVASIPSAWRSMQVHRDFYARNMAAWARGETLIPGPAHYSRIVERALSRGLYAFPCEAVEEAERGEHAAPARFCADD